MTNVVKFPNRKDEYERKKIIEFLKNMLDSLEGDIHLVADYNSNIKLFNSKFKVEKGTPIIFSANMDEIDSKIKNDKVFIDMRKEVSNE